MRFAERRIEDRDREEEGELGEVGEEGDGDDGGGFGALTSIAMQLRFRC